MQPQEPTPSSVEPTQDAPAPAETPSEPVEPVSRGSFFLQRLWRGRNGRFTSASEDDQGQEADQPQTSQTFTLTQEELDRRIQAETDRREAKRTQQQQQQAAIERRRKLRDEDPWAYAEEDRSAEQHASSDAVVSNMFSQIGSTHDRYTLDPIVEQLPAEERKRIFEIQGAGQGLDGRKLIVTESLKALEKHWKEEGAKDAEAKLRRNPAFRKQVLSEFRRGVTEPEFISGGASSPNDRNVSDILRGSLGLHRSA